MEVRWTAPGPGQWALDRSHMPPGCTPLVQHIMSDAMPSGMARVFAELGSPVETISVAFVNGHMYTRVRPLVSPDAPPRRLPPRWVLRVATRVHPEMRRRAATARHVQQRPPWPAVIAEWHNGGRQRIVDANLALQRCDRDALDDAALLEHVRDVAAHCSASFEHHFWLHGFDLGPLGQFLFEASEWGLDPMQLLPLLEGASPSTSDPQREAAAIRAQVEATGRHATTLADLRATSPDVAAAVDRYLELRGYVLFSRYDIDGITVGERPDLVVASIMAADPHDGGADVEARTREVRARVPADRVGRFDELLAHARDAMDLRDDNGPTTAEWPMGLLRHALLALGRRAVALGRLDEPTLALELTADELRATRIEQLPSRDELTARRRLRADQRRLDAPGLLGEPELAPPLDVLPLELRRGVGAVQMVVQLMGMDGVQRADPLHGVGVGSTPVRATACVAASPEEAFELLQPGQVLVVASTTPAYNLVLSLAGGVVTAEGGPMSHAAVLARELGIPAVVGARGALTDIPHGALVEVDPVSARVRVLSPS